MRQPTVILLFSIAFIMPLSAHAVSVNEVPNPRHANSWVSDEADMLSAAAQERIDDRIDTLEQASGVEIAVVTVPSVAAATPRDFGTQLFNHWGIGKAGEDNGLLVLMVADERRLEMETGYGLEADLPDSWLKRMQESTMVPHFQRGNFDRGLEAGVEAVIERLEPSLAQELSEDRDSLDSLPSEFERPEVPDIDVHITHSTSSPSGGCPLENPFVLALLLFLWVVIAVIYGHFQRSCPTCNVRMTRDRNAPGDTSSSHVYVCDCGFQRTINVSSNSGGSFGSSGSSFGGGGGGGSFGGGSSGGGGAGSSW